MQDLDLDIDLLLNDNTYSPLFKALDGNNRNEHFFYSFDTVHTQQTEETSVETNLDVDSNIEQQPLHFGDLSFPETPVNYISSLTYSQEILYSITALMDQNVEGDSEVCDEPCHRPVVLSDPPKKSAKKRQRDSAGEVKHGRKRKRIEENIIPRNQPAVANEIVSSVQFGTGGQTSRLPLLCPSRGGTPIYICTQYQRLAAHIEVKKASGWTQICDCKLSSKGSKNQKDKYRVIPNIEELKKGIEGEEKPWLRLIIQDKEEKERFSPIALYYFGYVNHGDREKRSQLYLKTLCENTNLPNQIDLHNVLGL